MYKEVLIGQIADVNKERKFATRLLIGSLLVDGVDGVLLLTSPTIVETIIGVASLIATAGAGIGIAFDTHDIREMEQKMQSAEWAHSPIVSGRDTQERNHSI